MVTEREYRISCIRKWAPSMKNRKVVIYGTGINARLIIEHTEGELNLAGLMDASQTGKVFYGYKVLSEEEVISLRADTIIIAAQIDSAIKVYSRIRSFCDTNNLVVFDLYGNKIDDLKQAITEYKGSDCREDDSDLFIRDDIKNLVDNAEALSVDLDALFPATQKETELLEKVWERKYTDGAKAFAELRKWIEVQQRSSQGGIESIYAVLQSYLCLSGDESNELLKIELDLRMRDLKANCAIKGIIRYAIESKKRIYLINSTLFLRPFWETIFEQQGIHSKYFILLNRSEIGLNKYNGLYRELFEYEPDRKCLHIGNDYNADGIAAATYGFRCIIVDQESRDSCENGTDYNIALPINRLREYCKENIVFSVEESAFEGYTKLIIYDQYYVWIKAGALVRPGWLEQLICTIEQHEKVSLVCSRVGKENETIFYAGELVKEDAETQKKQTVSGFLPIYDYVHYVNQISLVSFLVRKSGWDKVEDREKSLGDNVRRYLFDQEGYAAIYQPLSEVTCKQELTAADIISSQLNNDRKPKILVTDNLLPMFDRDAGSRCTWFYLKEFHKLGFAVTLMAQNFTEVQPYVMQFQQAGIRVIYGPYYRSNWRKWLEEEKGSFRYVYMQRPDSTVFFQEEIRKNCGNARFFYYAVDLHFLRLYREYEVTGNPEILKSSEKSKELELSLIESADVIHVVGSYEQAYLQRLYPEKRVRNIPIYIYDQKRDGKTLVYDAKDRKDLLYVGSFGHPPNLDAVMWFAESIFPIIVKKYPDIIWHVVGANPPVDVQKYAGKNLILHGFLSDEELSKLYKTCRIVVVPLRYGAGVKGKIVEASYYQMPIITTPIGAEGIPQEENNMIVCETAEDFATAVCNLYSDEQRLQAMSEGGRRLIENHYTEAAVKKVLGMDMTEIRL